MDRVMKRFDGRTAIVTGGARGMGARHARGFVAEGANVVIADVVQQEGRPLADELGDHAIFCGLDVTSDTDWAAAVAPPSTPSVRSRCWSTTTASCVSDRSRRPSQLDSARQ